MPQRSTEPIRELLDSLYRVDSGRILATLIRLLGDFDLAEEAIHEAFAAALSLWPTSGVPDNPRPWLISTARFKAIDTLRHRPPSFIDLALSFLLDFPRASQAKCGHMSDHSYQASTNLDSSWLAPPVSTF